jgi:hypothetical protein
MGSANKMILEQKVESNVSEPAVASASSPCGRHVRSPNPPPPAPPSLFPVPRRRRSRPPEVRAGCEDGSGGVASSLSLRSGGHGRYNGKKAAPARMAAAVPATGFGACAAIFGGHDAGSIGCWSRCVGSSAIQPPWRLAGADGARRLWRTWGPRSGTAPAGSGVRAAFACAWWWLRRLASGPSGDVGCRLSRAVRWLGAGLQSPAAELEARASTVAAQPF